MKTDIKMLAVDSSQIAEIGHDAANKKLRIRFAPRADGTPGALYEYSNVSEEFFAQFRGAESIGSFFYANIKKAPQDFPYKKLEPVSPADACAEIAVKATVEDLNAYMDSLPIPLRTDYRVESAVASRLAFFKIARTTAAQV